LIKYSNNSISYIKLIDGLYIGSYFKNINNSLKTVFNIESLIGSFMFLYLLPKTTIISNLLKYKENKVKFAKSAGTYISIFQYYKELNVFVLILPTGYKKLFSGFSKAYLGRNSNIDNKNVCHGKAGYFIKNGFKSVVRGVAMNPVDHPNGGRTKVNKPEKSP
jgi:large subunit ribosomal protein L2